MMVHKPDILFPALLLIVTAVLVGGLWRNGWVFEWSFRVVVALLIWALLAAGTVIWMVTHLSGRDRQR